jgi:hypothetical protein
MFISSVLGDLRAWERKLTIVHPEMGHSWMELSAVSGEQSANTMFLVFC